MKKVGKRGYGRRGVGTFPHMLRDFPEQLTAAMRAPSPGGDCWISWLRPAAPRFTHTFDLGPFAISGIAGTNEAPVGGLDRPGADER